MSLWKAGFIVADGYSWSELHVGCIGCWKGWVCCQVTVFITAVNALCVIAAVTALCVCCGEWCVRVRGADIVKIRGLHRLIFCFCLEVVFIAVHTYDVSFVLLCCEGSVFLMKKVLECVIVCWMVLQWAVIPLFVALLIINDGLGVALAGLAACLEQWMVFECMINS